MGAIQIIDEYITRMRKRIEQEKINGTYRPLPLAHIPLYIPPTSGSEGK